MDSSLKIYTIGHSDRSIDEFLALLIQHSIGILIDIRAYPNSGRFPHFSQNAVREHINSAGIEYRWAGRQLGGMRKQQRAESHPALPSNSFRGFAEHMETAEFQNAVVHLRNLAVNCPSVIMCAEKQASLCHRSLIADYLTLKNIAVEHIIDETSTIKHSLSELARLDSTALVYDRHTSGSLNF